MLKFLKKCYELSRKFVSLVSFQYSGDILTKSLKNTLFPCLTESKRENLLFYSRQLRRKELEDAPEKVKELVESLRADLTEFVEVTEEAQLT